ncbi:MAG: hypothetical protein ACTSPG_06555 [Candidatus Hodarchaeales archaeon]
MNDESKLPQVITNIVDLVEHFIDSQQLDRSITKPVKIRKSKSNTILTWNIYFEPIELLESNFTHLENLIMKSLKNIQGEVIFYNVSHGTISDQTTEVFKDFFVNKAKLWDVYLYKPEIFIYIRLMQESKRQQADKSWISLDIDIVKDSAWFRD